MQKERQSRSEFLDQMITEVNKIPVAEVVGSVVELVPRGRYLLGLCPFHADNNLGSFVVTPEKNLWRCFAEGIGGGPVSFVMEYEAKKPPYTRMPYLKAAFKLAVEYGIITPEEYKKYSGKRWTTEEVQAVRERVEKANEIQQHVEVSEDIKSLVYNAIPLVCPLSDAHKKHLRRERHLRDDEMKEFFTFPTRRFDLPGKVIRNIAERAAAKNFEKKLNDLNEDERKILLSHMKDVQEQLIHVPGFYMNETTKRVEFMSQRGIGMLVKNERGKTVGIQIRKETVKPGESRYIWFSSSFALSQGNCSGGAPSGAPGGIIPEKKKDGHSPRLFITEGKFKAMKIADKGDRAIYVSGVSTWKNVLPMLEKVSFEDKTVYLAFDADVMGNTAVHRQLSALNRELYNRGYRTKVVLWSIEAGKGIDDLIINRGERYEKSIRIVSFETFETAYDKNLRMIFKLYNVNRIDEISADLVDAFKTTMQKSMEKELNLI